MTPHLEGLLVGLGPWILFFLCAAETAFVTGLMVPAGLATGMAAFLASDGVLPFVPVALAAGAGAAVGDSLGFWLGRRYGRAALVGEGRIQRLVQRNAPRIALLFGRHPLYAVSLSRSVSFVRTLMPWAAGMSSITYPRYVAYDLLGLVGWGGLYLGTGYLAGESWQWVSGVLGTGWAVLFAAAGVGGWFAARRRSMGGLPPAEQEPPAGPSAGREELGA